jgi:hypothetical protein
MNQQGHQHVVTVTASDCSNTETAEPSSFCTDLPEEAVPQAQGRHNLGRAVPSYMMGLEITACRDPSFLW